MSSYIANANTVSNLTAQSPNFLPQLWKKGAELYEGQNDFFQEFEGGDSRSPVRVETDLGADKGSKITFRTQAGLYGDGVIGDELIGDAVEEWKVGEFQLEVDYIRHATRHNLRTAEQTALASEIDGRKNTMLGAWLGRKKTKHLSMMFREKLHATSQVFAGAADGVNSVDAIKSDHTISVDEIIGFGTQLQTLGGKPAVVGTVGKNPLMKYILVSVNEALTSLKQSSDYKTMQREAGTRGDENLIFKGGFSNIDGHVIREFTPEDHAGYGAIGSAMNAKALLGVPITAANTAQDIKGGGGATAAAITTAKYFEFFPLYAYRFTPADILSPSGTKYVLIYNLADGPGGSNAHKMGFYSYSANDGNKLTMAGRLRASASGIAVSTLGGVTWETGAWVGKCTDNHPAGAVIIETNSYGVPIGRSFFLGADAARRGYGKYRNERTEQKHEGGFVMDTFIMSVFGQTPTKRPDGRTPNALCVTHAIKYAGLPGIPDVTA